MIILSRPHRAWLYTNSSSSSSSSASTCTKDGRCSCFGLQQLKKSFRRGGGQLAGNDSSLLLVMWWMICKWKIVYVAYLPFSALEAWTHKILSQVPDSATTQKMVAGPSTAHKEGRQKHIPDIYEEFGQEKYRQDQS